MQYMLVICFPIIKKFLHLRLLGETLESVNIDANENYLKYADFSDTYIVDQYGTFYKTMNITAIGRENVVKAKAIKAYLELGDSQY